MMNDAGMLRQWRWEEFAMKIPATTGKQLDSGYGIFWSDHRQVNKGRQSVSRCLLPRFQQDFQD
jgi:hypothetical protein